MFAFNSSDLQPLDLQNGMALDCHKPSSEAWNINNVFIIRDKSILINMNVVMNRPEGHREGSRSSCCSSQYLQRRDGELFDCSCISVSFTMVLVLAKLLYNSKCKFLRFLLIISFFLSLFIITKYLLYDDSLCPFVHLWFFVSFLLTFGLTFKKFKLVYFNIFSFHFKLQ